jgi:hypothetical protein
MARLYRLFEQGEAELKNPAFSSFGLHLPVLIPYETGR